MGKINVLGFEIANLIAAGEVVDRPASVLKELLENAVDAGGSHIVAEIRHGGVSAIRVSDDGCGMTAEDLPVAIRRHATSKIKDAEDLAAIMTLGFRGEALAAISAVSDITIVTKTQDAPMGTMLVAKGGEVTELCEVGAAEGTTVLVENLFAHVPARRKFLKKDATEAMACAALVEKVAMSHPEISFRFLIDGKVKFSTAGDGEVKNVLYALYGRDFASRLLKVEGEVDGVTVGGYVGRSDNSHGNRNMQNVFINGRFVKSKTVMAALERAYTSYMAPERFPVCALYLELDPAHVDVNVHPAKLEVRFSDEKKIFEGVYWAVRAALEQSTSRPEMTVGKQLSWNKPPATAAFVPVEKGPAPTQIKIPPMVQKPQEERREPMATAPTLTPTASIELLNKLHTPRDQAPLPTGTLGSPDELKPMESRPVVKETPKEVPTVVAPAQEEPYQASAPGAIIPEYRYVGQAFNTYLFVEVEGELLVIDQHAAHERILFEEMLSRQKREGRVGSQGLLLPITVTLPPTEMGVAREGRGELEAIGFTYECRDATLSITSIPDALTPKEASDMLKGILGEMVEGTGTPAATESVRREKALYQIACKAAIKGGRIYGEAQLIHLIEQVLSLPDITVCPHGRPIAYRLTKKELDKQFDRIK